MTLYVCYSPERNEIFLLKEKPVAEEFNLAIELFEATDGQLANVVWLRNVIYLGEL